MAKKEGWPTEKIEEKLKEDKKNEQVREDNAPGKKIFLIIRKYQSQGFFVMEKMVATQTDYSIGQERSYEAEINLNAAGNSDWIIIPERIKFISVTVSFTGATGKIQTTTDKVNTIINGSPVAIDWPFGTISTNQTKVCRPCSGIRAVQVGAGTMKVTLRAQ